MELVGNAADDPQQLDTFPVAELIEAYDEEIQAILAEIADLTRSHAYLVEQRQKLVDQSSGGEA